MIKICKVARCSPPLWRSFILILGEALYFFVDMDYTSEGVASAYWEIAREIKFWKGPFSAHLEYNGGLSKGMSYKNAYLAGATYTF